jgi:hypothetical protein
MSILMDGDALDEFSGFAGDTSITLNFERSGDTWMFRFQPHPVPQVRFAVPLPSAFSDRIVNMLPLLVPSPHPAV